MSTLVGFLLLLLFIGPLVLPLGELTDVKPPQELARPAAEFISIPFPGTDGISMHVERHAYTGDQDLSERPVFVLLHGFAANLTTWDSLYPWLTQYAEVISYDRIPFGLSERLLRDQWNAENPYTDQAAVAQLLQLLDIWQIDKAVLVGNSAGGTLAMQLALTHPERVQGLILISPAVYVGGRSMLSFLAGVPPIRRLGLFLTRRLARNDNLFEMAYHDPSLITEQKRADARLITRVDNWDRAIWEFSSASRHSNIDVSTRLAELQVPLLLISGDDDRIIATEDTIRLADELREIGSTAPLDILPACGHLPQEECPQAVIDAIDLWLPTIGGVAQ